MRIIDFENKNVISEKLYFHSGQDRKKCLFEFQSNSLYYINDLGNAFSINKTNLS